MSDKPEVSRPSSSGSAPAPGGVVDDRPRALGPGRLVMAAFWGIGIWTSSVAVVDLLDHREASWWPHLCALLAGIIYLLAAIALTHNGRRMRILGWACIGTTIMVPILVSISGIGRAYPNGPRTLWAAFGSDFFYLPLLVSVIGAAWMWYSNPRRIVEIAEQVERPTRSRKENRESAE